MDTGQPLTRSYLATHMSMLADIQARQPPTHLSPIHPSSHPICSDSHREPGGAGNAVTFKCSHVSVNDVMQRDKRERSHSSFACPLHLDVCGVCRQQ